MTVAAARPEHPAHDKDVTFRVRVVYRDSAGALHTEWPADRLREAVADTGGIVWVDIDDCGALSNAAIEALLREVFGFHPLAIEDALKETHVPRVDDWGDHLFIVFHAIEFEPKSSRLRSHELDIFLGPTYLVTHHADPLPFLEQDRRNLGRDPENRLRHGPDNLLYHFLDLAVAEFFPAIERLDRAIDAAQEEVFSHPTPKTLQAIFRVKRAALKLHRILAPEREVLNRLARDVYRPIAQEHRVYFRDVYDHLVRVLDLTESLRDLISGALDTYLSAVSNRTNDIMKALTTVTVIFLPLGFITGFWGMNFFAENLSFHTPLPRLLLFVLSCLLMIGGFAWLTYLARRRGWL
jgi:magnesium transporter